MDRTGALSGKGGVRPTRLLTSLRFGLPRGRTTTTDGECGLPWHWNRNPIANPEYRPPDSRKAVSMSLSATNRVPMPTATRAQHQPHSGAKYRLRTPEGDMEE